MNQLSTNYPTDKALLYRIVKTQLQGLLDGVPYLISNLANTSALLWQAMEDINWVGFYLLDESKKDTLVLGPFQGKPACIEIKIGNGVCGTAVAKNEIQLVKDVHAFPGHIACDSASNSELVLPLHKEGAVIGVLDIDSPVIGRFDDVDREGLSRIVAQLEKSLFIP